MSIAAKRWMLTLGLLLLCVTWAAWADEPRVRTQTLISRGSPGRLVLTPPHDWSAGHESFYQETRGLYELTEEQQEKLMSFLTGRLTVPAQQNTRREYGRLTEAAELFRSAGISFDATELNNKLAVLRKQLVDFREENRRFLRDEVLTTEQQKTYDQLWAAGMDPFTGTPADEFLSNHKPMVYSAWKEEKRRQDEAQRAAMMAEYRVQTLFTGRGFVEQEWQGWLSWLGQQIKLNNDQQTRATDFLQQAKEATAQYRKSKEAEYRKLSGELSQLDWPLRPVSPTTVRSSSFYRRLPRNWHHPWTPSVNVSERTYWDC